MKDDVRDEIIAVETPKLCKEMLAFFKEKSDKLEYKYNLTVNETATIFTCVAGNFSSFISIILSNISILDMDEKIKLRNDVLKKITNVMLSAAKNLEDFYEDKK